MISRCRLFAGSLGVTFVLLSCSDESNDCLITDCAGSYCETDADCPSPRVCDPKDNFVSSEFPRGCVLPTPDGEAGAGS